MNIKHRILDAIPWDDLKARAMELVAELEDEAAPGSEKMDEAIRRLADWVDDTLNWRELGVSKPLAGVLEWADGRVIYWTLRGALEMALQGVREAAGE